MFGGELSAHETSQGHFFFFSLLLCFLSLCMYVNNLCTPCGTRTHHPEIASRARALGPEPARRPFWVFLDALQLGACVASLSDWTCGTTSFICDEKTVLPFSKTPQTILIPEIRSRRSK